MLGNQVFSGSGFAKCKTCMFLSHIFTSVNRAANKVQDIARTKALFWIKVSKEVCHQWLLRYEARLRGINIGPIIVAIKLVSVSLIKKRDLQKLLKMANTLAQRNEIAINSDVSGFVVLEWPFIYSTGTDHLSSVSK